MGSSDREAFLPLASEHITSVAATAGRAPEPSGMPCEIEGMTPGRPCGQPESGADIPLPVGNCPDVDREQTPRYPLAVERSANHCVMGRSVWRKNCSNPEAPMAAITYLNVRVAPWLTIIIATAASAARTTAASPSGQGKPAGPVGR